MAGGLLRRSMLAGIKQRAEQLAREQR